MVVASITVTQHRVFALTAFICFLLVFFKFTSVNADECKARFIECVQQTGNPLSCHAVSAACRTEQISDVPTVNLDESIQHERREGHDYVRLILSNPSSKSETVSTVSWGATCVDGSRERLYFVFNRAVRPEEIHKSSPIIACFNIGLAEMDALSSHDIGGQSRVSATIYCAPENESPIEITRFTNNHDVLEFYRSDGSRGKHDIRTSDGAELWNKACLGWQKRPIEIVHMLREEADVVIQQLLPENGTDNAKTMGDTNTTGVRN